MGHGTGVLWGGLTPLRGVLIRPQRVPATCKVGGSGSDPIEGGGLVMVMLETGVVDHLSLGYRGGWRVAARAPGRVAGAGSCLYTSRHVRKRLPFSLQPILNVR